ncbi:unnamed protein product [Pieris macdunnoughi]|uniref:Uncharacterized protein n=1 Tax=Pieris macdunnoughi TaxID=345717 RepID=A0A821UGU1_9NEOP|nr:unnamed protein product [Pieris macdunnoughi]
MKEVMSTLNTVLKKPQDDFDRYGKILANKLRKLSEIDRLKTMYEIDGLFVRRVINNVRPSSTCSLYSEPTLTIENPRTSTSHARPASSSTSYSDSGVQIHMPYSYPDNNNRIHIVSNEVSSPMSVDILSRNRLRGCFRG